jgi:hypothetical protein
MLVAIERGALTILDPLVHQRWTLAPPLSFSGAAFVAHAISADGRRVVAGTPRSLLAWSIELPDGPERWLDAMTNAVDDRTPDGLGWR